MALRIKNSIPRLPERDILRATSLLGLLVAVYPSRESIKTEPHSLPGSQALGPGARAGAASFLAQKLGMAQNLGVGFRDNDQPFKAKDPSR